MQVETIGKQIGRHRRRAGYSQKQFAKLAKLTPNYLSAVERGVKIPSLSTFIRIANILQVSADELLEESSEVKKRLQSSPLATRMEHIEEKEWNQILKVVDVMLDSAERTL